MAIPIERMSSCNVSTNKGCGGMPLAILTYIKGFPNSSNLPGADRLLAFCFSETECRRNPAERIMPAPRRLATL
jgi:hypothetical protein